MLIALVYVVKQYMSERDDTVLSDDSADERVIAVLTLFGLMEPLNGVVSRWTEEGNNFLKENYPSPFPDKQQA